MNNIIDGRALAHNVHEQTKQLVLRKQAEGVQPKLGVVLIGSDSASETYVRLKQTKAESLGIVFELHRYPATISYQDMSTALKEIQTDASLTGLIVQLPIPEDFYPTLINKIKPELDVDCLTYTNLGKIVMGTNDIMPPTPGAVMTLLDSLEVELKGKQVCIVGAGVLVGKPLAIMCMNQEATVTTVNRHTPNIGSHTKNADILISGVGVKHLITADMVKPGAIVIDAGVDFEAGNMFGDVDVAAVQEVASYVTPTPGGVGPLTVAILLRNVAIRATQI
jgi:methylenetetrahydrofolate dehydrogenase (NADP+)/methenyltetrahydrofolate cyclohydrolase